VQEVNRLIKTFEDAKQMLKALAKQQARGGRGLFRR
jgi:signal recognition particle subunit SRP54